jgi:protein tyrosine/serine phosphatase
MKSVFLIFFILVLSSCTENKQYQYIPPTTSVVDKQFNFHIVDDGVWRSSQPNAESIARMKIHGLKTVVNLRGDSSNHVWESRIVDSLGLNYVNFPMDGKAKQDTLYLREVLAFVQDENNQPLLLHCLGGKDRTGIISALYKLEKFNTPIESLKREMIMFGHDAEEMPALLKVVENWKSKDYE